MENSAQDSELAEEGQCEVPEKEQIKELETDSTGRAEKGLVDNDKRVDDRTEGSRNGAGRDGASNQTENNDPEGRQQRVYFWMTLS